MKLFYIILLIFFWLVSHSQQYSSTAAPYPVCISQPDGSKLFVLGAGNKNFHYTTTVDGYTIIRNLQGFYEFAALNGQGSLVPSGVRVSNAGDRTESEKHFLKNIPRYLTGSIFKKSLPTNFNGDVPGKFFPGIGTQKVLVLLVKFPDLENAFSAADFSDFMNKSGFNGTGSLRDYFLAASSGKLTLNIEVSGWYKSIHDYKYYGEAAGNDHTRDLIIETIDAAEKAGIDFSLYDNNKDGEVDNLVVIHSGPGAEEGSQNDYIWSHSWGLVAKSKVYDNVRIDSYMILPEKRIYGMVGIGTFCHEFGHALGLPDTYDTDDSNGSSEGLGRWCLMAAGSWLNQEHTPSLPSAYLREKLGWVSPLIISRQGNYILAPASESSDCFKLETKNDHEYFLLEYRSKTGFDAALPGQGMAIYHVNTLMRNNGDVNKKLVDLEEADGLTQLDDKINPGDAGDLFPGTTGNSSFNDFSNPNSRTYNNEKTGTDLREILVKGQQVSFRIGDGNISTGLPFFKKADSGSEDERGLRIYPDPGKGIINVDTGQLNDIFSIRVITGTGQVVYSEKLKFPVNCLTKQLNVNYLKSGLYIVVVESVSGTACTSFIVADH